MAGADPITASAPPPWRPQDPAWRPVAASLAALMEQAIREDSCPEGPLNQPPLPRDLTSALLDPGGELRLRLVSRQAGVWAGLAAVEVACRVAGWMGLPPVTWRPLACDGDSAEPGQAAAELIGPSAALLVAERSLLNAIQRLSGVATTAYQFTQAVLGSRAVILDTRKTLPGWRLLDKYAVRCGGGHSHRMGLHDAVLVKDNHLALVPPGQLCETVSRWAQLARSSPTPPAFFEVEVDDLAQLEQVLLAEGVDVVLLDNFTPAQVASAVALRDRLAPAVQLEASGGVTLDRARHLALAGVDRISIGALTHSAPALDVGLDAH